MEVYQWNSCDPLSWIEFSSRVSYPLGPSVDLPFVPHGPFTVDAEKTKDGGQGHPLYVSENRRVSCPGKFSCPLA